MPQPPIQRFVFNLIHPGIWHLASAVVVVVVVVLTGVSLHAPSHSNASLLLLHSSSFCLTSFSHHTQTNKPTNQQTNQRSLVSFALTVLIWIRFEILGICLRAFFAGVLQFHLELES